VADSDRPKGENLSREVGDAAEQAGRKIADAASGLGGAAAKKFGGAAGKAADAAGGAADMAQGAAGSLGGSIAGGAGAAAGLAKGTPGKLSGAMAAASGKGADALGGAASGVTGAAGSVGRNISAAGASASGGKGGWRSFMPPNKNGKFPWKWRWLGLPLILGACTLLAIPMWNRMEKGMNERALVHLACEDVDTSNLDMDWSYRSVTVEGEIPSGFTKADIDGILENGSTNDDCLRENGVNPNDDPGVYGVTVPAALAAAAAVVPAPDPDPTATAVPEPTATPEPEPTATPEPEPTATPEPEPTATPEPAPLAALAAAAAFDGEKITLTGEVASEDQRQAIVNAAVSAVGEANVMDMTTIVEGELSDARIAEFAMAIGTFGGSDVIGGTASVDADAATSDLEIAEAPAPAFTG